jgi:hypothetical protein
VLKRITKYKGKEDGESEGKSFFFNDVIKYQKDTGENDTNINFIISPLCEMALFF